MGNVIAFSGGKDSTALALRMHELGESFQLLFTPTGNELPELRAHIDRIVADVGAHLILPRGPSFDDVIQMHKALPNGRMRFCTQEIKILPCIAYLKAHPGSILCVGLRADEEDRQGLYGDYATYRYPLRDWGWGIKEVRGYLEQRGIKVPKRTDCALCPYQRLGEWRSLLREHPEEYQRGIAYEEQMGHTFRSPSRDTWPAKLCELAAAFDSGRKIRGTDDDTETTVCRVCRF